MDYKEKYIKYKKKYIKTKQLIGGNNIHLENNTNSFIKSLVGEKPIYKLTPIGARNVLNKIQADESYKKWVTIETIMIPFNDKQISVTIFRPKNANTNNSPNIQLEHGDKLPIIMYYHGGGWILGNNQTHGRLVSELAFGTNAAVIFVNYTPAPEGKYPLQINEAYHATEYIYENGHKHNLDTNKLVIVGDSVGGNMAIVMTMLAKKYNTPKIKYQVLLYPVTDANMNTESYKEFENGPWLTKKGMEWFFDAYEPDISKRQDPLISPINAAIDDLKNLPPGIVITDENDVLRDEGEAYAHKLMQAGVDVVAVRFLGTIHDFLMLDPVQNTPAAKSAMKFVIMQINEIFKR